jgi:hypothetical protein
MDVSLTQAASTEIVELARQRSGDQQAFLDLVRAATKALAAPPDCAGDPRAALAEVERRAQVEPDPAAISRRLPSRLARYGFRRLTGWDLRYIGAQVTVLGHAIARFGTALVERTEQLEEANGHLGADVAALAARVEHLEEQVAGR